MPRASIILLCVAALLAACKSGDQRQGMRTPPPVYMPRGAQMQQPTVLVRGDVRNPIIPWTEDLTLSRAILAADYVGRWDPHSVNVVRGRQSRRFSAMRLLAGEDMDLEPGDVVEIRR